MKPAPHYRIGHAARYQSRLTLSERVQVFDSTGWQPASASELAATRSDNGTPSPTDVAVIAIPKHLLKRWWSLAEAGDDDLTDLSAGFENYAREVAEYFNYKNWMLPADAVMEVVVSEGARNADEGDGVTALGLQSSRATRFSAGVGTTLACINLGDANVAIVLGAESSGQAGDQAGEPANICAEKLAPIRVILEPGDGVMLPAGGILWNRSTLGTADVDVLLLIGLLSPK
jgi:hypothetical protein